MNKSRRQVVSGRIVVVISKKRRSRKVVVACAVLALIAVIAVVYPYVTPAKRVQEVVRQYYRAHAKCSENWWIVTPPLPSQQRMIQTLVEVRAERVRTTIGRHAGVSAFAKEVASHYRDFTLSVHIGGMSSVTISDTNHAGIMSRPEICFVPQSVSSTLELPFSVYWRSDWGLMMDAIDWPEALFGGLLFHELGHGLRHPVSPTTVHFAPMSTEYVQEEIEMHKLETLVIDHAVSGQFQALIQKVIARSRVNESYMTVLSRVTKDDFTELDTILKTTGVGLRTAGLISAEFFVAVGLAHIERHMFRKESEQVEMYQWLHREAFSEALTEKDLQ